MLRDMLNSEIKIKKGILFSLIGALVVSTAVIGYLLKEGYGDDIIIRKTDDEVEISFISSKEEEEHFEEPVEEISVYVVGEVKNPSVVTLKKGQIIKDAILLAGGPTEDADLENINLAYILTENVMLQIKSKKSTPIEDKTYEYEEGKLIGINIVRDSGGAIVGENIKTSSNKVNINTATAEQLSTLPGIGPAIANNIVSFRQERGKFGKIEDIKNVSGIGDKKYEALKDHITVN
ncbi:UNVERIFIED_CONTAM: competence protein ComEA [Acetivibrio alkalicellulosi]